MRKVLVTFVLALTAVAMLSAAVRLSAQAATPDQGNTKIIKDPAEYNAYMTAANTTDPAAKAAALEAFINQYPNSIVKADALEGALAAYTSTGNQPKVQETATKILQINPNSVRALAIVTYIERATGKTPQDFAKARQDGEKGLTALESWQKPQEQSDADFAKQKDQMTVIFAGAAGFGALQVKDYDAARKFYQQSVKIDPTNLQDVYQLGIASLESNPLDKTGFWYIAKAYHLAQGSQFQQFQKSIGDYGKSKYRKYHGNNEGWDQFLAGVASQSAPGSEASITPAPSAQELACKAVQDNDPASLSFSDWEYILQYRDAGPQCNKDAAEKVWQAIQGKQKDSSGGDVKIKLPGVKVIKADSDSIDVALTEDNQKDDKADLHVVMDKPLPKPPTKGATIDVIGTISSYTPNPFMFTMTAAEVPGAAPPPKPPARKPTPTHRPGGSH